MIFIYCARVCVSVCVGVCDLSFGYFIYEIYIHCDALTDTQIKNRKTDEGERKREREISRSLLINILVCWFHFVCLREKFWLAVALGAVGGVWNLHSTCLILFEFATVDTRHSWTNNRGGGEEREEQERITRDWEKFERICSKSKSIEFSSAIDAVTCRLALSLSWYPLFEPHFPFVILHSFCQFLCRSSSLKTNDVIGQFSTLPSRLFTRVTTTTTITTTTVLHNLAFCYTC